MSDISFPGLVSFAVIMLGLVPLLVFILSMLFLSALMNFKKKGFVKRSLCPHIIGIIMSLLSAGLFMYALEKRFLDDSNTDKYIFLWVPVFFIPWFLTAYGMRKWREGLMKKMWKSRPRRGIG